MYAIGYDIGSSSVKAALVNLSNGKTVDVVQYPKVEMAITAPFPNWAEQDPKLWWDAVCKTSHELIDKNPGVRNEIKSIGISYQMHGLVLVDKNLKVLRPAIIWCDSRTNQIGKDLSKSLGEKYCFENLLNQPGNFTASKLKWVIENEPEVFKKTQKVLLPGDFIAMKLSGAVNTTVSGLSEGTFWDFKNHKVAEQLMNAINADTDVIPEVLDTFSEHGKISRKASKETGLPVNTPITYRAGDQPNNALSLGVFEPGDIAATGGTSGVVYGVTDLLLNGPNSGINSFAHVNHSKEHPRIGQLLCINGAGSQYAWIRNQLLGLNTTYADMEKLISPIPIGSEGLRIIPFGNGAERMINNQQTGAQINNLQFNIHSKNHMIRSALEGIAFSFVYGIQLLSDLGINLKNIKVGNDNLFQSEIFSSTIVNLLNCEIQMQDTTGAIGAALASGKAIGAFSDLLEAFSHNQIIKTYKAQNNHKAYYDAYEDWKKDLNKLIN